MNCRQVLTHVVREGESFYTIAGHYRIPMEMLMAQNPGLDPYNLQVGTQLKICMDPMPPGHGGEVDMNWGEVMILNNEMRKAWVQHVYWTRMLMNSIFGYQHDQSAVTDRLMSNPMDIAGLFGGFYPPEVVNQIAGLLTEHLEIGGALMTAVRDGNTAEATRLNNLWYDNADRMAAAFDSVNPQYDAAELRNMLYRHLDLLKQQIAATNNGNYPAGIEAFDEGEDHILNMADYFTSGLVWQFPQRFS